MPRAATTSRSIPSPKGKATCQHGGGLRWLDLEESFELLGDEEALTRIHPVVPVEKRPLAARLVLHTRHAKSVLPAGDDVDPFE
jgi:hypothetical protein